ncbi:ubiquitin carboxyl-terminal hydrolase 47-like [Rhinoraja longicauda]
MSKSGKRNKANPTGFVGIYNQGATCYLNTLLQTFYMSPEVRDAIIIRTNEQTFEKTEKGASITYQLKELFAKLDAREIPRTDLITRNLGMSSHDVYKQQDVAEYFRRVVNKVGKETEGLTCNILQIYQSKVINCQRCLECKVEATTECIFLDIPLPVHSNDRGIHMQNVNATFQDFLKTSILDGDNLCYCDRCDKKTESEIRYYFEKLPQILVLQLKRFEVDYFARSMKKMHEKVEIPLKMKFQKKRNKNNDKTEWCLSSSESNEAAERRRSARSGMSGRSRSHEREESLKSQRNKNSQESNEENFTRQQSLSVGSKRRRNSNPGVNPVIDTTYNLFAICNHAGEFGGGHYVAHIRPESSSKWYCFDDSHVTETEDFVSEACRDNAVPCIRSSTAYLLMYRKEKANNMEESVGGTDTDAKTQRIKTQGIRDGGNTGQQSNETCYPNLPSPPGKNRIRTTNRGEVIRERDGRHQTEAVVDNRNKPTVGDKSDEKNIKGSKETRAEKTISQCSNENSQIEVKLEQAELTDVISVSNDNEKGRLITNTAMETCTEAESAKSGEGLSVTDSTEANDCGCCRIFQTFSNNLKEHFCC